jgi:LacI family transcriptional regulator
MTDLPDPKHRVVLKDVAKLAGVHVSTASRALNPMTMTQVASDVLERVQEAALALRYRPNTIASSLRTRRTKTIGLVLPDVLNAIFPPMIKAAEEALARENYLVLIAHAEYQDPRQRVIVDQMMARQIDGMLLATSSRYDTLITACIENHIPFVTLTRSEPGVDAASVVNDEMESMSLVVRHLVELGHRRIGHIGGPAAISTGVARQIGFNAAMAQAGLTPTHVELSDFFTREAGAQATARLLDAAPTTTALVTANDLLAIGALDIVKQRGLKCPTDISIVGHNDMPLVDVIEPPLTTVRIDFAAMGAAGARLLLDKIADPTAPVYTMTLRPQLVRRGSTANVRSE